jgi:hypothetical protein
MATVHADDSEEVESMQNDSLKDKMSRAQIFACVLGVVVTAVLAYSVVKNINNKNK